MPELLSFDVAIFLCGTLAAAFVTGLSGFAFGMVAAAIWVYALPPPQASALIAAYALLVQGYAVWKLRHLLDLHRLMPFIVGSALGIPGGRHSDRVRPLLRCQACVSFTASRHQR